MNNSTPLVSICCATFNQESFISQAIESFLSQKTSFKFEIIIHDDASTDGTASIVKKYEQEHPNLIKAIYQKKNQYSQGIKPWPNFVFPIARGKYIALCEGDDYWTDPYKLQKQVDFLEANPEYTLTCHRYQTLNEKTGKLTDDVNSIMFKDGISAITFGTLDLFDRWISKTLTVVFRNNHNYSKTLAEYQYPRDVHLFYHILKNGKGYYFNFIGGVYRQHDGGVFSASSHLDKLVKGTLVFKEIAKKNPECKSVYERQVNRVRNEIDANILAQRLPFLHKENYILIRHIYCVCNKKYDALFRLVKLFFIVPKKVIRKIMRIIGFQPSKLCVLIVL